MPGNFHDSLETLWYDLYDNIYRLLDVYFIVSQSSFNTSNSKGKIIKGKYNTYNYFINDDNRLEFYSVSYKNIHLTELKN